MLSWTLQRSRSRSGWFGHLEVGIETVVERGGESRRCNDTADGTIGSNEMLFEMKIAMFVVTL